jgi:LAS superfamily LD-carboxypeptidase LdcB
VTDKYPLINKSFEYPTETILNIPKLPSKHIKKPSSFKKNFIWLLLVCCVLFCGISVGVFAFSNSKIIEQEKEKCHSFLTEIKNQGLNADVTVCDKSPTLEEYFLTNYYTENLNKEKTKTQKVVDTIKEEIVTIRTESGQQLKNLELLSIKDDNLKEPSEELILGERVIAYRNYQGNIQKLFEEAKEKINKEEKEVTEKINLYEKDLPADQINLYKSFFQMYSENTPADKILKYQEFEVKSKEFDKIIIENLEKIRLANAARAAELAAKERATLAKLYNTFSGEQYRLLYESIVYNYTSDPILDNLIFNNPEANKKIIELAENRGYRRRRVAIENRLVAASGERLQPEAQKAWETLNTMAKRDGINLVMVSGYRSVNTQKDIFLQRLPKNFSEEQIAEGQANEAINNVLKTSSVPAYSRHHTGYTFDLGCNSSDLVTFGKTVCYEWISKDNYLNAKLAGLIPSYPTGTGSQGPDPEAWEYVWVGENLLKK